MSNERQAVKITKAVALQALERVVERHGSETLVKVCTYSLPEGGWDDKGQPNGEPTSGNCILGCMFHEEFDVPLETLKLLDSVNRDYSVEGSPTLFYSSKAKEIIAEAGLKLTDAALRVLNDAQETQDTNYPWGEALDAAKGHAKS